MIPNFFLFLETKKKKKVILKVPNIHWKKIRNASIGATTGYYGYKIAKTLASDENQ